MARAGTIILDVGDTFPDLKLKLIDGSEIQTKTGLKHSWNAYTARILTNRIGRELTHLQSR